jgi:hypothetical protein
LKDRQNLCAICYLYFSPHPKRVQSVPMTVDGKRSTQ